MDNVLLPLIVVVIAVALLFLRTNALLVFFALCAGNVLVQFASKNMAYVNGNLDQHLLPSGDTITKPSVLLAILVVPPILVAVLAKHNNGPSKWPIQLFPALATGVLGALFIVPLLTSSFQNSLTQSKAWSLLEKNQIPIVGLCVIVSLVILILSTYASHSSKKHHKS